MRNYAKELKDLGYSYKHIAGETGLTSRRVSSLARGIGKYPKSTTETYNTLRNTTRRLSYRKMVESGVAPEQASRYRRTYSNPKREITTKDSQRFVKFRGHATRYQMRLVADYWNTKTGEFVYMFESFSHAYLERDEDILFQDAINNARGQLGESNWELYKEWEREIIEYILSGEDIETGAEEI